jgi:hypothetical protein
MSDAPDAVPEDRLLEIAGTRVLLCAPEGPPIAGERDATDLVGLTFGRDIGVIAIPAARLDAAFYRLASGLLGAVAQKFVNYRLRLAVIGDVSAYEAKSAPFRDFVREANRGRHVWFVPDEAALARKLEAAA